VILGFIFHGLSFGFLGREKDEHEIHEKENENNEH